MIKRLRIRHIINGFDYYIIESSDKSNGDEWRNYDSIDSKRYFDYVSCKKDYDTFLSSLREIKECSKDEIVEEDLV